MKKIGLICSVLFLLATRAQASDLLAIYQQALTSDPTYLQAVSQRLSDNENLPISISSLLPNISVVGNPTVTRTGNSGASVAGRSISGASTALQPRNITTRAYTLQLALTQTLFDYGQFAGVASALATVRGADATLNAALQNLMVRATSAYLAILRDEDNLSYASAQKIAYKEQLDQVNQQYQVGIKTITDVYTAQARYDQSTSDYIAVETRLSNDRENLRVITGKYYPSIATLSEDFPLISPKPTDVELWVKTAAQQNWDVRSSQYTVESARAIIHQQFSGHLPTVQLQSNFERQYQDTSSGYNNDFTIRNGSSTQTNRSIGLNINVPLFEGGQVVEQTNQAVYNYQVAQQKLEYTLRTTINTTRQSYLNVVAGISKIDADKQAVKSNQSSLDGMEASYRVGTETLVNVLNQRQLLFQAQTTYAKDRYDFVQNILTLKQAAGTLSFDDLRAINAWLVDRDSLVGKASYRTQRKSTHIPAHSTQQTQQHIQKISAATKKTIQAKAAPHKQLATSKTKLSGKKARVKTA